MWCAPTNQGLFAPPAFTLYSVAYLYKPRALSRFKGRPPRSSQELRHQAARLASMQSYRHAATTLHELLGVDLSYGFQMGQSQQMWWAKRGAHLLLLGVHRLQWRFVRRPMRIIAPRREYSSKVASKK